METESLETVPQPPDLVVGGTPGVTMDSFQEDPDDGPPELEVVTDESVEFFEDPEEETKDDLAGSSVPSVIPQLVVDTETANELSASGLQMPEIAIQPPTPIPSPRLQEEVGSSVDTPRNMFEQAVYDSQMTQAADASSQKDGNVSDSTENVEESSSPPVSEFKQLIIDSNDAGITCSEAADDGAESSTDSKPATDSED